MRSKIPSIFLINFVVQGMHTPILPMGFGTFRNFLHQQGLHVSTGQFNLCKASEVLNRPLEDGALQVLPPMTREEVEELTLGYYESVKDRLKGVDVVAFSGNPQVVWHQDLKRYARSLKCLLDVILESNEKVLVFVGGGLLDCFKVIAAFSYLEIPYHNRYFFHNDRQKFMDVIRERFGFEPDGSGESVYARFPDHTLFPEYDTDHFPDYTVSLERVVRYFPETAEIHEPEALSRVTPVPYAFSEGCPNRCAFCEQSSRTSRYLSVDRIMEDLWRLRETYPSREVYFLNSQFMRSRTFCSELCRRMIDEKLNIRWFDSTALSVIDEETAGMLAEAGCTCLWVGIECPSDRMLKFVGKKVNREAASRSIRTLHDAHIWIGCNLILGMPHETDDDVAQMRSFIEAHRDMVNAWQLNYFAVRPGSLFFEHPDRYDIRVFPNPDGEIPRFAHDEVGGLSWAERKKKTNGDYMEVFTRYLDWEHTWINMDPYLIFSLFRSLEQKSRVQSWLRRNREALSRYLPFGGKKPFPR